MTAELLTNDLSRRIWNEKYRLTRADGNVEAHIDQMWRRVARALSSVEAGNTTLWGKRFYDALYGFRFIPGGRILAGAGSGREVTLFNCFVMGTVRDSLDGIFEALKEGAITMQQGGGIGYDFSTLRPRGSPAKRTGTVASGPVSFMRIWDSMCETMISSGNRRGAMMATLRCDHPDILAFVEAKRDPRELRNFNLSVLVTDELIDAVRGGTDWPLIFPQEAIGGAPPEGGAIVERPWGPQAHAVPCRIFRTLAARDLWDAICRAAYDCAEPGVLFIDRINRENNLNFQEYITATNPCGEVPLPPYGACDLGSINLTRFVLDPFTPEARIDLEGIRNLTAVAVRMLDNVIDASNYPLPQQAAQARGARRIGLGITGLADALMMLGLHYGELAGREKGSEIMRTVCHSAYRASIDLAREKGPFPTLERDAYLAAPFIRRLPEALRASIRRHGIRNSHLISIAPTGTVSLLANNISGGIEPVFAFRHHRTLRSANGERVCVEIEDWAFGQWRDRGGDPDRPPASFVEATALPPERHLAMQAALQPYVDNAISKTVNVPPDLSYQAFRPLFERAYELGLKGCTVFRPNPIAGAVLTASPSESVHCCGLDRECD